MRTLVAVTVASGLVLAGFVMAGATSGPETKQTHAASAEFARIQALGGTWKGTSTELDGKQQPAVVEYRVTSGGSAVVETLFPGTAHEMVSVYRERNGQVAMTHYCMLGNQPELALINTSLNQLVLSLAPNGGIDEGTETHMHALTLAWADPDHLTQTWTLFEHGKAAGTTTVTLSRER